MSTEDIRWKQRFANFLKVLALLEEAVTLREQKKLTDLELQGLIQRFEFTHELAWKVLKDYLEYQGESFITGSRDATRDAFNRGLIEDGENWMEMITSRNRSSHTYDGEAIDEIAGKIAATYFPLFLALRNRMNLFIE